MTAVRDKMDISGPYKRRGRNQCTRYPIEPFRQWLYELLGVERRANRIYRANDAAKRRVSYLLGVTTRQMDRYLKEMTDIDEITLDRLLTAYGLVSIHDIYPDGPATIVVDKEAEEIIYVEQEFSECASVRCREVPKSGRFCEEHAAILDRVRVELQEDADLFRNTINRKNRKPTCCTPGCYGDRERGHSFCERCHENGADEEDYS